MQVRVTKSFLWAPDGNHVRTVAVGEVLDGRGAEVALQVKAGDPVEAAPPGQAPAVSTPPTPAPPSELSPDPRRGKRR